MNKVERGLRRTVALLGELETYSPQLTLREIDHMNRQLERLLNAVIGGYADDLLRDG